MYLFIQPLKIVVGLSTRFTVAKSTFLVVFNVKGASYYYENAGNLEMLVTNSRSNQENAIDDVSVAVLNVLS